MPAEHLLRVDRRLEALVGQIALDHRRDQPEQVVRLLALRFVRRAAHEIDLQRTPQHKRAPALVPGARFHQHPANVGMDDDRIGLRRRVALGLLERPALAALARVARRVLVGDLALSEALQARRRAAPRSS